MENQVQTIVCPNCGANASNHTNCEYCGSLLVRFADKNIAFDESKYGKTAFRLPGLEEALTRNLEVQKKTNGKDRVHTFMEIPALDLNLDVTNPKAQTEVITYSYDLDNGKQVVFRTKPRFNVESDEQSLVICLQFLELNNVPWGADYGYGDAFVAQINDYNSSMHRRFSGLALYDLFTMEEGEVVVDEHGVLAGKVYMYYLNFGRDVDGAAAIITQYVQGTSDTRDFSNLRVVYSQEIRTDEEYDEYIQERSKVSNRKYTIGLIVSIVFLIVGIFMLFDEEYLIMGILTILGMALCIYRLLTKARH